MDEMFRRSPVSTPDVSVRTMHYRRPLRSAMQPDRISLGPVHPRPYDLFPLARQREHVLAIDQLHQCRPVTCISRAVMRWASADVTVSNIRVPNRTSAALSFNFMMPALSTYHRSRN